jgi:hypothetical protein
MNKTERKYKEKILKGGAKKNIIEILKLNSDENLDKDDNSFIEEVIIDNISFNEITDENRYVIKRLKDIEDNYTLSENENEYLYSYNTLSYLANGTKKTFNAVKNLTAYLFNIENIHNSYLNQDNYYFNTFLRYCEKIDSIILEQSFAITDENKILNIVNYIKSINDIDINMFKNCLKKFLFLLLFILASNKEKLNYIKKYIIFDIVKKIANCVYSNRPSQFARGLADIGIGTGNTFSEIKTGIVKSVCGLGKVCMGDTSDFGKEGVIVDTAKSIYNIPSNITGNINKNTEQTEKNSLLLSKYTNFISLYNNNYLSNLELIKTIQQNPNNPIWIKIKAPLAISSLGIIVTTSINIANTNDFEIGSTDVAKDWLAKNDWANIEFARFWTGIAPSILGTIISFVFWQVYITISETNWGKSRDKFNHCSKDCVELLINDKFRGFNLPLVSSISSFESVINETLLDSCVSTRGSETINEQLKSKENDVDNFNENVTEFFDKYLNLFTFYNKLYDIIDKEDVAEAPVAEAHLAEAHLAEAPLAQRHIDIAREPVVEGNDEHILANSWNILNSYKDAIYRTRDEKKLSQFIKIFDILYNFLQLNNTQLNIIIEELDLTTKKSNYLLRKGLNVNKSDFVKKLKNKIIEKYGSPLTDNINKEILMINDKYKGGRNTFKKKFFLRKTKKHRNKKTKRRNKRNKRRTSRK